MPERRNRYRIVLEQLETRNAEHGGRDPMIIEFDNHDEIFRIIERGKERDLFGDQAQSVQFALGIKLFGEVMMRNRDNPLFTELSPAFKEFMKRLKSP
jgi:hypothetical protein